ncbi:MAG: TaqI-like C-terminal specificity domain-containing protein, partial [bacterium]
PVYSGVADLYVYFYHRGLTLVRKGGRFGMITSNKFLRSGYGKPLREWLATHAIHQILDFRDLPVFAEAIAYPLILIAGRRSPAADHALVAWSVSDMAEAGRIAEAVPRYGAPVFIKDLKAEGWSLERPEVARLMDKLRNAGRPLEKYVDGKFYYGIKTGFNEAFVIDEAKRKELIAADPKSAELIKPYLRGRDVHRWSVQRPGLYLIFTRRGVDPKRYPAILRHLSSWKKELMPGVPGGRKPGTYEWYEIQDAVDYYAEFDLPTIRYQDISTYQQFAFTKEPYLSNNTTWILPTDDLSLLAVLNSSCAWWFLDRVAAKVVGGAIRLFTDYVGQIPIPEIGAADRTTLVGLVETILAASASGDTRSVLASEPLLDDRIMGLFGLSPDERRLIAADPAVTTRLPPSA